MDFNTTKNELRFNSDRVEDHELDRKMEDLLLKHKLSKDKEKLAKVLLAPSSLLLKYKDKFVKPSPKKKLVLVDRDTNDKTTPDGQDEQQSPKRGKIRPKSVSGTRPKPPMHMNSNTESLKSKKQKSEDDFEFKASEKPIALEDWIMSNNKLGLDGILKSKQRYSSRLSSSAGVNNDFPQTDARPVSAPVNRSRRFMTTQEATLPTQTRPPSANYIKDRIEKEKVDRENFAAFVTEEANQLQSRCIACIDEANEFSKVLKKDITFVIHTNGTTEKILWEKIRNGEMAGITGSGRRIEKMSVEVHHPPSSGLASRTITMDAFFREHARLHQEIHRNRCLQPATSIVPGEDDENQEDSDKRQSEEKKPKKKLTKQQSVRMTLKNSLKSKQSTTAASETENSTSKPTKEETEERLKKILQGTIESTRILEAQLRELRARGWNSKMTY